jgi:hypothetical protein
MCPSRTRAAQRGAALIRDATHRNGPGVCGAHYVLLRSAAETGVFAHDICRFWQPVLRSR